MLLTRAEITAVYAGGVDAVIGVIEQLQAVVTAQQEQIAALSARGKELENQAKTTRRTSSKPPPSDGDPRPPRRRHHHGAVRGRDQGAGGVLAGVSSAALRPYERAAGRPVWARAGQRHAADRCRDGCAGPRGGGRADQGGPDPRGRGA